MFVHPITELIKQNLTFMWQTTMISLRKGKVFLESLKWLAHSMLAYYHRDLKHQNIVTKVEAVNRNGTNNLLRDWLKRSNLMRSSSAIFLCTKMSQNLTHLVHKRQTIRIWGTKLSISGTPSRFWRMQTLNKIMITDQMNNYQKKCKRS